MSNRPPDDDFGFDDEEFSFDDEGTAGESNEEFSFDNDDEFDFGGEDEFDFGGEEDITFEEEEERRGPSRTFIIIAAAMIGLFLVALAVLVLFVLRPQGPTPLEQTATSIVATNNKIAQFGQETATAAVFLAQTQTAQANLTATELARPTDTPTPSPTASPTASPTPDLTQAAAFAMQTQAAFDLTSTADALAQVPTIPPTIAINAVAQTATALAQILQPTVGGAQVVATPTGEGQVPTLPTALPDTGLFDDLAAGGTASLGGLVLAIAGLIGVIFISRRLRAANR
jgi:hypothetical protein